MALLTLVRHGQASFLAENYDKLSDLGERQAQILGEYWLRTGVVFDQVYYGPASRHFRTGDLVGEVYRQSGLDWPEPIVVPDLDEYPGIKVVRTFLPGLMETHEEIRTLEAEFRQAEEQSVAFRMYDRMFERITRMWVNGELDSPEVESWAHFTARIDRGIDLVRRNGGKSARVVVFTSGGVIASTVRIALDIAPQKTLELSWASRNASYSDFLFSPERFSLRTFNSFPHLELDELLTFR